MPNCALSWAFLIQNYVHMASMVKLICNYVANYAAPAGNLALECFFAAKNHIGQKYVWASRKPEVGT